MRRSTLQSVPGPIPRSPTVAAAASTDPAVVGRWTPKFSIPGVAVHTVVLRTGKILYFTGTTQGRAYLLDPVSRTTRAVHPPRIAEGENEPANIFCAAQSFLDDGTVVVMGGHHRPARGPEHHLHLRSDHRDMAPTGQHAPRPLVPDAGALGRRAHRRPGRPRRTWRTEREPADRELQAVHDDSDFVTLLGVADSRTAAQGGLYPHTFQMPSGRVLVAGPEPSRQLVLPSQPDRCAVVGGRAESRSGTRGAREC